ncbi:hypothetical protein [Pinibacter soli]|nr:hypothetical protein [Pinibacter soli]
MGTVKAMAGQTLIDLAIQASGSLEALFDIALLNGISITDELTIGQIYKLTEVVDDSVVNNLYPLKPASALFDISDQSEGIDYWAIEKDFIVN